MSATTSLLVAPSTLLAGAAVLGAGTYASRLAGTLLRSRARLPPQLEKLVNRGVVVLLAALVGVAALIEGAQFAGPARVVGVAVGGLLAWRKAPFVLVVPAAALTAAGLRLLGVR